MSKTTRTYWNPLAAQSDDKWEAIENSNGLIEQLTLAMDKHSGDYTRLTRFKPGADSSFAGAKSHQFPEEVFIVSGRLYDAAFDTWLETGDYASRPPGEVHGPFRSDVECVVLEISYPGQTIDQPVIPPKN